MTYQILVGDCRATLADVPEKSIHCCVTSPPYYALRDYGVDGQIGLEQSPEDYLAAMVDVFRAVRRVLRNDGLLWVNLGDGFQDSNLLGMPWRLAFALHADGWILRGDAVWRKPSPMPESISGTQWQRCRVKVAKKNVPMQGYAMAANAGRGIQAQYSNGGVHGNNTATWTDCPGCPKCEPNGGYVLRRGSWRPLTLKVVRAKLFTLIDSTPWLDWMLLTKRPENIPAMWCSHVNTDGLPPSQLRRPNVWLGTSVSDQATADRMIPKLLQCRDLAPVLFVSAEPLLGPIDLTPFMFSTDGFVSTIQDGPIHRNDGGSALDWVIVGGESGPKARPCDLAWIRSIVKQCRSAGVPCFVKQMGQFIVDRNDAGFSAEWNGDGGWPESVDVEHHIHGFREDFQGADCRVLARDRKGGDPAEWPADLRVREFPVVYLSGGGKREH